MRRFLLFFLALPLWGVIYYDVYYSVGQNTTDHKTGTPTMNVASGVATFDTPQTSTAMGVGDRVTYNTTYICYVASKSTTSIWNLVTVLGQPCPNVSGATVNSIAHEFTSLNAAIGGNTTPGAADANHLNTKNLVGGGYILHIPLYYDSGPDTSAISLYGGGTWTTGASNYIQAFTPYDTAAQCNQTQRHNGLYSATKYRLTVSSNGGTVFEGIDIAYFRLEGIQITNTHAGGAGIVRFRGANPAASDIRFTESLVYTGYAAGTAAIDIASGTVALRNIIQYGSSTLGLLVEMGSYDPTAIIQNCTFGANATYGVRNIDNLYATVTVENSYSGGNGTSDYDGTMTFTTSASSDATARAGVTPSIAYTTSNFVNVTGGSEDLHLVAGASSTLLAGGTDLHASFTTDIDGMTRYTPWSIGTDQLPAAAGVRKRVMVIQ